MALRKPINVLTVDGGVSCTWGRSSNSYYQTYIIKTASTVATLACDWDLELTSTPPASTEFEVYINVDVTSFSTFRIKVFDKEYSTAQGNTADLDNVILIKYMYDGTDFHTTVVGLSGADGAAGDSAYDVAVANGFVGSEAAWLTSLEGIDGTNGTNGNDGQAVVTADVGVTVTDTDFTAIVGRSPVQYDAIINTNGGSKVLYIRGATADSWSSLGSLVGADGADGDDGFALVTSNFGGTVVDASFLSVAGRAAQQYDSAIDTFNSHLWVRGSSAWSDQGSIVGADGADGSIYTTTSTSTIDIDGSPDPETFNLTVDAGLSFSPGQSIVVALDGSNYATATVLSYSGTTLSFSVDAADIVGTCAGSLWYVNLSGGAGAGTGDVSGGGSSTDNAIVRWDGTSGQTVQNSVVTIADSTGNMAGVGTLGSGEITSSSLTASRALVSGSLKEIQSSAVTATELGYLSGVSSAIQTQFSGKEPTVSKGNLTEIGSSILTITGGSNAVIGAGTTIQVQQASSGVSGYLLGTHWDMFNGKQAAIATGTDHRLARYNGTNNIQDSVITVNDTTGNVSGMGTLGCGAITSTGQITSNANSFVLDADAGGGTGTAAIAKNGGQSSNSVFTLPPSTSTLSSLALTETLSNKTLASPKVGTGIYDSNGAVSIAITATATAVNYFTMVNSATTDPLEITANGSDANISMNLVPKGSGTLQSSGVEVVNLSATQTLTNKTLTSPKVGTAICDTNGNEIIKTPATGSAVNEITVTNAATGNHPQISATGSNSDINLDLAAKGSGVVTAGGVEVVTISGTQNLTQKTLTQPKIQTGFYGTNSTFILGMSGVTSAVNYVTLSNAATGNPVTLTVGGSDTNIGITITPKGTGYISLAGNITSSATLLSATSATASFSQVDVTGISIYANTADLGTSTIVHSGVSLTNLRAEVRADGTADDNSWCTEKGIRDAIKASRWQSWAGASRTADNAITSTTNLTKGTPVRYRATAGTWRYGIVLNVATNIHTLSGHPCTTSDDDEFQYGNPELVRQETFIVPGAFAAASYTAGATGGVLYDLSNMPFHYRWMPSTAYLVEQRVGCLTDDSTGDPTIVTEISSDNSTYNDVFSSTNAVTSTELYSGVTATPTYYQINHRDYLDFTLTAGTTGDARDLQVQLTFVFP